MSEQQRQEEPNCKDWSCHAGAVQLAKRITEVWLNRGFAGIRVEVDPLDEIEDPKKCSSLVYPVRSNIGPDGFPPRA